MESQQLIHKPKGVFPLWALGRGDVMLFGHIRQLGSEPLLLLYMSTEGTRTKDHDGTRGVHKHVALAFPILFPTCIVPE